MFGQLFIPGFLQLQEVIILIVYIGIPTVVVILLLRKLGAWMFRINDVKEYQKEMINILKKMNDTQEEILKSLKGDDLS